MLSYQFSVISFQFSREPERARFGMHLFSLHAFPGMLRSSNVILVLNFYSRTFRSLFSAKPATACSISLA